MLIQLSPVRADADLHIVKQGDTLTINGVALDFSRLGNGCSLPAAAIGSSWVTGTAERIDGDLVITLRMPHGADASERARFPTDIVNPADGQVFLPTGTAPPPISQAQGVIDWSQVVTAEMKAQAIAEQLLAQAAANTAARRTAADAAIAPLQDAVDLDDATGSEKTALKAWKQYRVALNRLPEHPGYPAEIDWPAPPA